MIDRRLGQESLGIWDFAWSLVTYFDWVNAGIGSSVQSYVARYRAEGNADGVNRVVSTAAFLLGVAALLAVGLTTAASLLLPSLFGYRLGPNVREAQWIVLFLGATVGSGIFAGAFRGVLTGCHRWGLHNVNTSGWYAATVAAMIIALLAGGGLRILAAITFAGQALGDLRSLILAHRVFEGLRLRPSHVRWLMVRELFAFGGKSLIPNVSNLLLNQTTSILIVCYLGPAALALYSRPRGLVNHVYALINKYASVVTPIISSLESERNLDGIRDLLIKAVRYSLYMALPMILVLVFFGGTLMRVWMGARYANGLIPAILALGSLAPMSQIPVLKTLQGLNAHGRAGISQFAASLCSAGLTFLALGPLGLGTVWAAVAVTVPVTIVNLVYLPPLVCRRVGLGLKQYFLSVAVGPMMRVFPFAACLLVARLVFPGEPLLGLVWGGLAGSAVLAALYWRYVLPKGMCAKIRGAVRICRTG